MWCLACTHGVGVLYGQALGIMISNLVSAGAVILRSVGLLPGVGSFWGEVWAGQNAGNSLQVDMMFPEV